MQLILVAAAVLAALGVIFRIVRRAASVVALIESSAPTVLAIAEEFKESHGASLRQQLDLAVQTAAEAAELSRQRADLLVELKATMEDLARKQASHRHKTDGTMSMLAESTASCLKSIHELNLEMARRGVRLDRIESNISSLSDLKELLRGDLDGDHPGP